MTLIQNIQEFLAGAKNCFLQFIDFVNNDSSGVMITFVVAFPLAFLGVWIINKIVHTKDTH